MVLSDKEIRKYSTEGSTPLIVPFSEDQLQGASYDVSMSGGIIKLKSLGEALDPQSDKDLRRLYEYISVGDSGYLLSPGEYVLAELTEEIHLPKKIIAHLRPRTRFTRCGLIIADQHCNPAYNGVMSVGLFNAGVNPFILRPNLRIAQIVFEELASEPSEDRLYKNKTNAVYSEENKKTFRGTVFREAGWTAELEETYSDLKRVLSGGSN